MQLTAMKKQSQNSHQRYGASYYLLLQLRNDRSHSFTVFDAYLVLPSAPRIQTDLCSEHRPLLSTQERGFGLKGRSPNYAKALDFLHQQSVLELSSAHHLDRLLLLEHIAIICGVVQFEIYGPQIFFRAAVANVFY